MKNHKKQYVSQILYLNVDKFQTNHHVDNSLNAGLMYIEIKYNLTMYMQTNTVS